MLNRFILAAMAILVCMATLPQGQAQSSATNGPNGYCLDFNTAVVPGVIAAGVISLCVEYHDAGRIGDRSIVSYSINSPAITLPTITGSLTNEVGCTEVLEPAPGVSTINAGFAWSRYTTVDMTDTTCTGSVHFTITAGAAVVTVLDVQMGVVIVARDDATTVLTPLCAATGGTQAAYSPTTTTCSTPSVNVPDVAAEIDELRSNLCRPTGNHGHCELDLHGGLTITDDATGWAVNICPSTSPCFIESNSTTTIGNATQNVMVTTPPGFWELFGPTLLALAAVAIVGRVSPWFLPLSAAGGMAILVMAFTQPNVVLILVQAAVGAYLAAFSIWSLALVIQSEKNPKKWWSI